MEAAAVIVTIGEAKGIDEIVAQVRALRQDMLVVSRARDAEHARHLYQIGVTDAVPETIEASLLLSEAALIGLGVAMGLVVASIHEKREEFRHELQQAAGGTRPAAETTGVRRKPSPDLRTTPSGSTVPADALRYRALLQSGRISPETPSKAPSTSSATRRRL